MFLRPLSFFAVLSLLVGVSHGVVAQQADGIPVIAAEVREVELVDRIEALGTTFANESIDVTSTIADTVAEIHFTDGQEVARGDLLVVLNRDEEFANLKAAQANLAQRQREFERAEELVERRVASEASLDESRALLLQAQADVEVVEARLAQHRIVAPFSGVVGLRDVSLGAYISPGDLITTLDDIETIKIDFSVPAIYLASLRPGLAISAVTSAYGERVFDGEVQSVDSRVDPVTRSVVVRAVIDNADLALRPGMLMQLELLREPRLNVVVPEAALVPQGQDQFVYVIDDTAGEAVELRQVTIGSRMNGMAEVVDGMAPGELVVTHGTTNVRPGQVVDVRAIDDGSMTLAELLASLSSGGSE
ncbi:MAG: efflux RND transporter periplasmic adaptor subunit [Pseudomonadota bacterium]